MTLIDGTDIATKTRYETPSFAPSGAFTWTLRSGEVALLGRN